MTLAIDAKFAPYASPENVMRVLERVRKGGVKRIDPDFLISIGINEGMVNRTLRALEFLGFIDQEGNATELFERYKVVGEDDARQVLLDAIHIAYEPIFHAIDPESDDRNKVSVAFRNREPSGQWTRMVTLFLGLCSEAGMNVLDTPSKRPGNPKIKERAVKRPERAERSERPATPASRLTQMNDAFMSFSPPKPQVDPALQGLIAKFSDIKSVDELDRWYATLKTVFQFVNNLPAKENGSRLQP